MQSVLKAPAGISRLGDTRVLRVRGPVTRQLRRELSHRGVTIVDPVENEDEGRENAEAETAVVARTTTRGVSFHNGRSHYVRFRKLLNGDGDSVREAGLLEALGVQVDIDQAAGTIVLEVMSGERAIEHMFDLAEKSVWSASRIEFRRSATDAKGHALEVTQSV